EAFAQRLGVPAPQPPDVDSPEFDSPLLVHMAALLAVHGEHVDAAGGDVRGRVLAALLDRERGRWFNQLAAHRLAGPDGLHPATAQRAVLAATLARPDRVTGAKLLTVLAELADDGQVERRDKTARWLDGLFPEAASLGGLGPDLLVEQLLTETSHD